MIKAGILDFGSRSKMNSMSKIEDLLAYAVKCEQLNFSRFWLGEHHYSLSMHPWTSPDILLAVLCGMTDRIRMGAAGVLLPAYSPYNVATNYKMLNNLFENRLDLGLAKSAPDNEHICRLMLNGENDVSHLQKFTENLAVLYELFYNEEENYEKKGIMIPPYAGDPPQMWYLARSNRGLDEALKYRCNYSKSLFHHSVDVQSNKQELNEYRSKFKDSYGVEPDTNIAVACYCAVDDATAIKEYDQLKERFGIDDKTVQLKPIVGSPERVCGMIYELAGDFGVDEVIIIDMSEEPQKRHWTVEQLSKTMKLT